MMQHVNIAHSHDPKSPLLILDTSMYYKHSDEKVHISVIYNSFALCTKSMNSTTNVPN